jgi:NADPH:quinone reductase-like Zn-dependent oxidoreductase
MHLEEVAQPQPKDDEVLIQVRAAGTNAADWHLLRGKPFLVRLVFGLLRPRIKILGADVAGVVAAVGAKVSGVRPGDEVFGNTSESGWGTFAEYVCAKADAVAPKPAGCTFEEAAAVPMAAVTALQALRDGGRMQPGHKVLINGASGGVGTFAVQIAKAGGAEVTGVCSTANLDLVRSLGADHVIDYTREDVIRSGQRYDVIMATAGYHSIFDYRRALTPSGSYVLVGGDGLVQAMLLGPLLSLGGRRKLGSILSRPTQADLRHVKELIEAGKLRSVIDRRYPLAEVPEAIGYVEAGHAKGKVVITVSP